jgi:hypothetical protein
VYLLLLLLRLQLRAAMEADPQWQQYVKERLEPRNALESVFAWKCGRPTVHEPSEPPRLPALPALPARPDCPPCPPALTARPARPP